MRTTFLLLLLVCLSVPAQRRGGRPKANGQPGSDLDMLNAAVATFDGTLRTLDKKELSIELPGEQHLSMEINKKTEFFRGQKPIGAREIREGALVLVEAKKVANQLVALRVRVKDAE